MIGSNSHIGKFKVGWASAQQKRWTRIQYGDDKSVKDCHHVPHSCWAEAQPTPFCLSIRELHPYD